MRNFKILIQFDGRCYEGWQSQKKSSSVQEVLEKACQKIFEEPVQVSGSSRTDSGVHARGFVASFKTGSKLSSEKIKDALNFYLPSDICITNIQAKPQSFHARFSAKKKWYRYQIWNSRTRPVFEAPFVLRHPWPLDLSAMRQAAKKIVGRHDFKAFMDREAQNPKENTIRHLIKITIKKQKKILLIDVIGDAFLRHMVRVIVGTLVEVGRGKIKPTDISTILKSGNRKLAGPTVKPEGLCLMRVYYSS